MLKKTISAILALTLLALAGCGGNSAGQQDTPAAAAEGSVLDTMNTRIDQLAADAGLEKLSADVTLMPIGTRAQVQNGVSYKDGVAAFSYTDGGTTVEYIVDTNSQPVKTGLVEVFIRRNGAEPVQAVTDAGTAYLTAAGDKLNPKRFAQTAETDMEAVFDDASGSLWLKYTQTCEGVTTEKTYGFAMKGKSLVLHVTSSDCNGAGGYSQFYTGGAEGLAEPRIANSVYAEEVSVTVMEDYFFSAYLDKAKTFATRVSNTPGKDKTGTTHGMTAYYDLNSAGQTNPMNEIFYVTVSDEMLDCVYLNNGEKSPYRDVLNDLVIYDNWMYTNSYSARKYDYQELAEAYGLTDVLLVEHRWQRDTLDISNPAHFPASTQWGSADEFQDYITTVKEQLGWKLCLHEDYWFIQPSDTNQYWNIENVEDKIAQEADGTLRFGWQETSYANLSNLMTEYAAIESPQIEAAYDPDASFLDVNGGVDPSLMNQVTLNAESKTSRTLAQVVADNVTLFQHQKEVYGGPVISEGAQGGRSFGSAYAGYLDSGSREITDCSNCKIMPDYELIHIRPKMANQGMGPPARFQPDADVNTYDFDKLNATCLAYGHAGFIGDTHYSTPLVQDELLNAYYSFRAIQPQYLDTNVAVEEISYFDQAGNAMDLDAAVLADYDFKAARLYIRYSNGLEIYLNFSNENWEVFLNGNAYTLDKNGYAAENPNENFVQFSCLLDGVRVDYVKSDLYTYYNPRGNRVDFGDGMVTNQMEIRSAEVEVSVASAVKQDATLFVNLVDEENGANGLTFYYTDGQTLTPFTERSTAEWGWKQGDDGLLVYPKLAPADNYGAAGTSAAQSVVMGYRLPNTGTVELGTWTALQGPSGEHGYRIKVAVGTLDNVLYQHDVVGDTQTVVSQNYSMEVEKDQELYVIYEPLVQKDQEWFGYKLHLSYLQIKE